MTHNQTSLQRPWIRGDKAAPIKWKAENTTMPHKDTPKDVQEKIASVAKKTVMSERAQTLASETGALVYWQPAAEVVDQIAQDIETMDNIGKMLGN